MSEGASVMAFISQDGIMEIYSGGRLKEVSVTGLVEFFRFLNGRDYMYRDQKTNYIWINSVIDDGDLTDGFEISFNGKDWIKIEKKAK